MCLKVLLCTLEHCLGPLNKLTSKGCSENNHSGNQGTTFPWINNSANIESMKRMFFFSKCSKFYVDFKNAIKNWENVFCLEVNCVRTCSGNFCLLWEEYMWSAVNVLKDGPNNWYRTKRDDKELTLFDINGKLAWKWCCAHLSSP